MKGAKREVETCEVAGGIVDSVMVVTNKEVKHRVT